MAARNTKSEKKGLTSGPASTSLRASFSKNQVTTSHTAQQITHGRLYQQRPPKKYWYERPLEGAMKRAADPGPQARNTRKPWIEAQAPFLEVLEQLLTDPVHLRAKVGP